VKDLFIERTLGSFKSLAIGSLAEVKAGEGVDRPIPVR